MQLPYLSKNSSRTELKQASHWHDKRFTPRHAIWRANDGRTRNSVREDAWRCGSGEVVRAMSWRKFWNLQKSNFQCVTTCQDEIVKCAMRMRNIGWRAFREQLVTYAWQCWHASHDTAQTASPCRLDRLRASKMARLDTPYCEAASGTRRHIGTQSRAVKPWRHWGRGCKSTADLQLVHRAWRARRRRPCEHSGHRLRTPTSHVHTPSWHHHFMYSS